MHSSFKVTGVPKRIIHVFYLKLIKSIYRFEYKTSNIFQVNFLKEKLKSNCFSKKSFWGTWTECNVEIPALTPRASPYPSSLVLLRALVKLSDKPIKRVIGRNICEPLLMLDPVLNVTHRVKSHKIILKICTLLSETKLRFSNGPLQQIQMTLLYSSFWEALTSPLFAEKLWNFAQRRKKKVLSLSKEILFQFNGTITF